MPLRLRVIVLILLRLIGSLAALQVFQSIWLRGVPNEIEIIFSWLATPILASTFWFAPDVTRPRTFYRRCR
jgi:hypothetical protein